MRPNLPDTRHWFRKLREEADELEYLMNKITEYNSKST